MAVVLGMMGKCMKRFACMAVSNQRRKMRRCIVCRGVIWLEQAEVARKQLTHAVTAVNYGPQTGKADRKWLKPAEAGWVLSDNRLEQKTMAEILAERWCNNCQTLPETG